MATISGTVKDANGNFAAKLIRAYRRSDGALAGQVISNETTGAYSITTLDGSGHFAVVHDGAISGDPLWDNVTLAMHMDDTGLTDVKNHAITRVGNAARSATQSKFSGYSAYFDGSGDYLTTPTSGDWNFGASEFTIEAWVYLASYPAAGAWRTLCAWHASSAGWRLMVSETGVLHFSTDAGANNGFQSSAGAVPLNQWVHIAATGAGAGASGWNKGFVNGSLIATKSSGFSFSAPSTTLKVGTTDGANWFWLGYIDDLRITKGMARYTDTFSPPAAAFEHNLTVDAPSENALIFDNITPI